MSRVSLLLTVRPGACGRGPAQPAGRGKPEPAPKPEPPPRPKAQYQVTAAGDRAVLVDASTGEQWELIRIPSTGRSLWFPLKEPLRGEDAKKGVEALAEKIKL